MGGVIHMACLSCPHNIKAYGKCGKGYENWYYRVSKKNGCSICAASPQLSSSQIREIQKKKTKDNVHTPTEYTIYTDGGCAVNPGGPGGIGIVMINRKSGEVREISEGYTSTTNNRMEVMTVIRAVEQTDRGDRLYIVSDSKYVVNSMSGVWRKTKNLDLWDRLEKGCKGKRISVKWIRGHSGIRENERCDKLATCGINSMTRIPDTGYTPEAVKYDPDCRKQPAYKEKPGTDAMGVSIIVHTEKPKSEALKRILALREKLTGSCRNAIRNFGSSSRKFRDYMSLKTGGTDEVSKLSEKDMREMIPEIEQQEISRYLTDKKDQASCMRWHIRGLSLEDSIRKALVDREVRQNCF